MSAADSKTDDEPGYASPPCFMHELDPSYTGVDADSGEDGEFDVDAWRKAERARLIQLRRALPTKQRRIWNERIAAQLKQGIGDASGRVVSTYWPFRGEPDLRSLMTILASEGASTALPVVVARGCPLVFRQWKMGDPLEKGVWNIPVPAEGAEVVPDIVIAPVVGFDALSYRLGYGGGFFDRTLATMAQHPQVFGVGYDVAAIPTIHPQAHDVPMDMIVTETGVRIRD